MPTIQGVIFDLDGVIVSTDELHFQAWKKMAEEETIPFSREDNERLRGVSRMESLEIILEKATRPYSEEEKLSLAEMKNNVYRDSLGQLSSGDILPGVNRVLDELRQAGVKIAIGSSSKNARPILEAIGMAKTFDVVVDGTDISRSKPDPEVFLLAGQQLGLEPPTCLVVEDADAGVEAGVAAGMPVLAVGSAQGHAKAALHADDLSTISVQEMISL